MTVDIYQNWNLTQLQVYNKMAILLNKMELHLLIFKTI